MRRETKPEQKKGERKEKERGKKREIGLKINTLIAFWSHRMNPKRMKTIITHCPLSFLPASSTTTLVTTFI